jgi:hypothetical protein
VLCDEPDAAALDRDSIELHHIAVPGSIFEHADLPKEGLLRLLVALVQHLDGHLLQIRQAPRLNQFLELGIRALKLI